MVDYRVPKVPLDVDSFLVGHQDSVNNIMDKNCDLGHHFEIRYEINSLSCLSFFHLNIMISDDATPSDNREHKVRKMAGRYNIDIEHLSLFWTVRRKIWL